MTTFPNSFFRSNPPIHWQMYLKEVRLDRTPAHDNAGTSPSVKGGGKVDHVGGSTARLVAVENRTVLCLS